eukprot:scaffold30550_cov66-Phaeocystis_antarctica.AAC.4
MGSTAASCSAALAFSSPATSSHRTGGALPLATRPMPPPSAAAGLAARPRPPRSEAPGRPAAEAVPRPRPVAAPRPPAALPLRPPAEASPRTALALRSVCLSASARVRHEATSSRSSALRASLLGSERMPSSTRSAPSSYRRSGTCADAPGCPIVYRLPCSTAWLSVATPRSVLGVTAQGGAGGASEVNSLRPAAHMLTRVAQWPCPPSLGALPADPKQIRRAHSRKNSHSPTRPSARFLRASSRAARSLSLFPSRRRDAEGALAERGHADVGGLLVVGEGGGRQLDVVEEDLERLLGRGVAHRRRLLVARVGRLSQLVHLGEEDLGLLDLLDLLRRLARVDAEGVAEQEARELHVLPARGRLLLDVARRRARRQAVGLSALPGGDDRVREKVADVLALQVALRTRATQGLSARVCGVWGHAARGRLAP